jgi:very-short-patch-repair endonuclease
VNVKPSKEGLFSLTIADSACLLNHHLFGKSIQDIEGASKLQEELECDLFSLQESISKAFKYLDVHLEETHFLDSQEFVGMNKSEPHWAGNFILFRGGRSAVNAMLRKDISTILKYPKFIEDIGGTALGFLLDRDLPDEIFVDVKSKFSALNDDQQKAVNAALSQRLTVITGPPGTGKSQVVTNILAICALRKKSVLFASKNNKAVDVVYDKLRLMLDKDNWILRLGNGEKIKECQERIMGQLGAAQESVSPLVGLNESLLETEQKLADISKRKSQLEKQQILFGGYEENIRALEGKLSSLWASRVTDILSWDKSDDQIKTSIDKCYRQLLLLSGRRPSPLWLRLVSFFFSGKLKKYYLNYVEATAPSYLQEINDIVSFLQQNDSFSGLCEIYENFSLVLNLKYLYSERDRAEKNLLQMPTALELKTQENAETERQILLYQQKLRSSWGAQIEEHRPRLFALCRRYFSAIHNPPQGFAGWRKFGDDFIGLLDYFHVWIVTNLSARKSIPLEAKAFDLVVIDEASQCDILSALPLLYRAKSAIIIGDPKQLKHISLIDAKREKEIAARHGVTNLLPAWSYRGKSIYDVVESKLLDSGKPPELLSFHYRCHPDIIGFSNNVLYENRLSAQTDIRHLQNKFQGTELGVFWHDVKGSVPSSPTSAYNQEEVDHIINLIEDWRPSLEAQGISVGVVTPFRKQVDRLNAAIEAKRGRWSESFLSSIVIGTAHRFQGDECDLVIFSPVVARGIKPRLANWVASTEELLNVAITRARGAFHVVGDKTSCQEAGFLLGELALYIQNCRRGKGPLLVYESPAEEIVGEILSSLELSFFTQVEKGPYRLDFIISTPFGNKINLEVDGRQHYTPKHVEKDEIRDRYITGLGYKVVRVNAKDTFTRRESLKKRLSQLV